MFQYLVQSLYHMKISLCIWNQKYIFQSEVNIFIFLLCGLVWFGVIFCLVVHFLKLVRVFLDRHSTLEPQLQPFFVAVILEIVSHFLPRLAWTTILLFRFLTVTGMTGVCHNTPPFIS
jgi:hypothetical protein